MADEFERKFLVRDPTIVRGLSGERMAQGYLPVAAPTSVRVRITDDGTSAGAYLTIKEGRSARHRLEFEYPIPVADAEALLAASCGSARVRKTRYRIEHAGRVWEVDSFEDANAPLMLAELELPAADSKFETPPWVGVEVTDDVRLLNVNLCRHPFAAWSAEERDTLLGRDSSDPREENT